MQRQREQQRKQQRKQTIRRQNTGRWLGKKLLELLYPPRCPICDRLLKKTESSCCDSCMGKLPRIKGPRCLKCGKPVACETEEFCPDCGRYPHQFDQGTAAFTYTGSLRDSVYRLKYQNRRDYVEFFGSVMADALGERLALWQPQLIIAVPMHWRRRGRRGYNQAELLARQVSSRTGIPYERKAVRCVRQSASQKKLNRRERMENLKGCYQTTEAVRGISRVLVADDVYTTGSTMDEIASVLKASGVSHVFFVVLCTGKAADSHGLAKSLNSNREKEKKTGLHS